MNTGIRVRGVTELGDKCEVKFDMNGGTMSIRFLGVEARPEYVLVDIATLAQIHQLLDRLERSNNDGHDTK